MDMDGYGYGYGGMFRTADSGVQTLSLSVNHEDTYQITSRTECQSM